MKKISNAFVEETPSRHLELLKLIILEIHYRIVHIGREHTLFFLRNKY